MSTEALYEAMGLEGDEVEGAWKSDGTFYVQVVVPRHELSCRKCGSQRVHMDERGRRSWESAQSGIAPVDFVMDSPRGKCLGCGAKTWHQPAL